MKYLHRLWTYVRRYRVRLTGAIVLGILGSFYPAFVATRASPAEALERA